MGDNMSENVFNNNDKKGERIDKINNEKGNFKILHCYSESKFRNSKDIEKRLFEVFRKYEK